MDPFVHLRVASGHSLQYGASHPDELVAAAAAQDMDTLALTDRDGLYGAVRFADACQRSGIAPVVGVDLAVPHQHPAPSGPAGRRTAAKGGQLRDPRHPRVVTMATSRQGWAEMCRLVTQAHLSGERGRPVASRELLARHASSGHLLVLLGADSPYGEHVLAGRHDQAREELRQWLQAVDPGQLVVAATHHQSAEGASGSARHAAAMVAIADEHRVAAVLTNQVRMAHRHQAATVDVLDAARRRVPLDRRNVDRSNAEAHLKPGKQMLALAEQVAVLAGRGRHGAAELLAQTRTTALRSRLDPRADIGLGELHLPEFELLGTTSAGAMTELRARCEAGIGSRYVRPTAELQERLGQELSVIGQMGYASYFLTVAELVRMVRAMGIRCAARGSGAGSLVNHLLGISGVDPMAHGLLMERFLSPLRHSLPDIDLDVESARRTEIYEKVLEVFGGRRVACVAMMETYRVRHAVRDVGAAMGLPPSETDQIAKAFPHVRARDARKALEELPELRHLGLGETRYQRFFELVESLDGLPRHVALHPCGIVLSDATLADRSPLEASHGGFPMSQFDKQDVEELGLLKLDVLGIRMQSAMAHAVDELERTGQPRPELDALAPFDDPEVYDMIAHAQTLGCFQIESPGQRELVGKFGPSNFGDIIIDISLFRPGPVKSNMVVPFLEARQGWAPARYPHPDLEPVLAETGGVVVFHEQVIRIIAVFTGCTLAQADEARRALGSTAGQLDVKDWFFPAALARGYQRSVVDELWQVLEAFASFGFCKAHAAAFALPTYQSAWLKRHHPAHFLAGVLTHDPGMYPKRLVLEEARRCGITVLGVDINHSHSTHRAEHVQVEAGFVPPPGLPDGSGWAIRLALGEVAGSNELDIARIVAGQPYASLTDFWQRAAVDHQLVHNLVLAGAFDELYGIGRGPSLLRHGHLTRRDLLLALADLRRQQRVDQRAGSRARGLQASRPVVLGDDPRELARRQARSEAVPGRRAQALQGVQLALDFTEPPPAQASSEPASSGAGDGWLPPADVVATGLPEMDESERLAAELEILGMDVSQHVVEPYRELLDELGTTRSGELLGRRQASEHLVAGVKVATQTPPVRSGRRVVFLTLDDASGPVDATFFEDAQGHYAPTVFTSWLLVVRGELRRTGPRGVSLRATGAWDLMELHRIWREALDRGAGRVEALALVRQLVDHRPEPLPDPGPRRMLVHPSGFVQSPYADIRPAGISGAQAPRKLWHSSPGSGGR
ncbi:hypothetical protein GCM10027030_14690 [Luteococcus sediminum]